MVNNDFRFQGVGVDHFNHSPRLEMFSDKPNENGIPSDRSIMNLAIQRQGLLNSQDFNLEAYAPGQFYNEENSNVDKWCPIIANQAEKALEIFKSHTEKVAALNQHKIEKIDIQSNFYQFIIESKYSRSIDEFCWKKICRIWNSDYFTLKDRERLPKEEEGKIEIGALGANYRSQDEFVIFARRYWGLNTRAWGQQAYPLKEAVFGNQSSLSYEIFYYSLYIYKVEGRSICGTTLKSQTYELDVQSGKVTVSEKFIKQIYSPDFCY